MKQTENKYSLSDGRNLGYHQYGDLNGFPVFAFHGLPGSRIWFKDDDEICKSLGIHLITVDRPGFGSSDQKKNRTFLDFSDDIQELSTSLGLTRYSVFGISGGGVYAAALAYKYPESIYKCGLISTVNRFENGKPPKEMASENRMVFFLSKRFPWLMKLLLNQQRKMIDKQPDSYVKAIMSNTKHLCAADRMIMEKRENAEFMVIHMGEAFKQGVEGTVTEAKLFSRDWGFHMNTIKVPIELWHGTDDTLSPVEPIKKLGDEIQNCKKNFVNRKGHFLTEYPDIWERILSSLKEKSS